MTPSLDAHLRRWREAGLLDSATAERILAFEAERAGAPSARLHWPALIALAFGTLMVGAGLLLFVAAHWDRMGTGLRFGVVLAMVGVFHLGGAWFTERVPRLATALHALGTLVLGAGIFLSGQVFHLQEHWPGGVMLWAFGALLGWLLLRDWVQGVLVAILVPAWLGCEWTAFLERWSTYSEDGQRVMMVSAFLLALSYLTGRRGEGDGPLRRALGWIGGLALIPLGISVLVMGAEVDGGRLVGHGDILWTHLAAALALGTLLALGAAWALRRRSAGWNVLAAVWALPLALIQFGDWTAFAWSALGCVGLVAWGLHEGRRERLNLGVAGFALTVFVFYFAHVMDKLGRSLGLMGLGLLFLLGGWQLERLRRRLGARIAGGAR